MHILLIMCLRNWYEVKSLKLIILGILVHVSLFFGALDVYFSSPVEHGLASFKANCSLANRAVIFIADGLRYEAVRDIYSDQHTPFLNKIRRENASWGVCFTRVPTESRPGHVALFGGMYEDPSAVLSGWKHNPINVDNIFNQSAESWLWGSPDIVPMFNKDNLKKINTFYYDTSFEHFSGGISTIELDRWVIENVKDFFLTTSAHCDRSNCNSLFKGGKIFFLHLLGMDTVGHVFKPNSREYFENLKYVDGAVQEIYNLFENFFGDNRTAYIFTSDHGMTDWGSHGSGSAHETQSPFIAWGSGLKDLGYSYEIFQADVAPLVSGLLGINIPTNSVGLLPYAHLNTTDEEEILILYANLRQLGERFNRRHERIERATLYGLFRPFNKLNKHIYYTKIHQIEDSIDRKQYKMAKNEILTLLALIQEGDKYVSQYYKYPLLFSLSIALTLWMIYLVLQIIPCPEEDHSAYFASKNCIFRCIINYNAVLLALAGALQYNGIQLKYWFYLFFPSLMVIPLLYELNQLIYLITFLGTLSKRGLIVNTLVWSVGLSSLVYSFYNETYIVVPVLLLIFWGISERQHHRVEDICLWIIIISSVCFYPTLSKIIKAYSTFQSIAAYFLVSYTSMVQLKNIANEITSGYIFYYHAGRIVLITMAVLSTMINVVFQSSLQFHICIASWFILFASIIYAALSPGSFVNRCFNIGVLFFVIYTLMSNSGESLFLVLFIGVQLQWLFLEAHLWNKKKCEDEKDEREADYDDFRRCLFFICFILMSYFGAGNLANMNTFDPMWARQFVLVFNPFLSAVIILFKITIPFLVTTIFFQTTNSYTNTPTIKVFPIIMLYCEVLVMHFLNSIKNEGSWLSIGLSISRFLIVSLMTLVLLIFYGIARFLTQNMLFETFVTYFTSTRAGETFHGDNL